MGGIRNFAEQEGHLPPLRCIDSDAPAPMRQELLAVIYDLLPLSGAAVTEQQIYYGIEQMLGVQAAGNPMAGWRQRLGRDLGNAEWIRIYDVIGWGWSQFQRAGLQELFRENINRVLAAHGVVWELGDDGRLHRVLPLAGQAQVAAAFAELAAPRYAPALALANAARDAYDGDAVLVNKEMVERPLSGSGFLSGNSDLSGDKKPAAWLLTIDLISC